jgi:hypothetical protein
MWPVDLVVLLPIASAAICVIVVNAGRCATAAEREVLRMASLLWVMRHSVA